MKVKTSITLDKDILKKIDHLPKSPSRSEVIEEALVLYFSTRARRARDQKDLELLNAGAASLNEEALEVLDFQEPL